MHEIKHDGFPDDGPATHRGPATVFRRVCKFGFKGMVSKRLGSPRSGHAAAPPSSVMKARRFMSLPYLGSLLSYLPRAFFRISRRRGRRHVIDVRHAQSVLSHVVDM